MRTTKVSYGSIPLAHDKLAWDEDLPVEVGMTGSVEGGEPVPERRMGRARGAGV